MEKKAVCGQAAKEQARDLWYLCNHYVLSESPRLHTMWIGRYYVLAILFSNLFVSFVLLLSVVGFLLFLLCLETYPVNGGSYVRADADRAFGILESFGFLLAATVAIVWVYSLWVCSWQFHRAYVERTFPIFYVLSRASRQKSHHHGQWMPERGTGFGGRAGILAAGIAGALGYWLGRRGVRGC